MLINGHFILKHQYIIPEHASNITPIMVRKSRKEFRTTTSTNVILKAREEFRTTTIKGMRIVWVSDPRNADYAGLQVDYGQDESHETR